VNIEAERVRNQLTQKELSAKLGVSVNSYLNYIKEVNAIPSDVLIRMATLFHCSIDYLLGFNAQTTIH